MNSDLKVEYSLTANEVKTLDSIFNRERKDFDFNGKVIGFAVGNTGTQIESKKIFFEKYIDPVVEGKSQNVCSLIILTKDEISKSGGFDAVIMSPAKILTTEHRDKLFNELSALTKSVQEKENYEVIKNVDLNHDFLVNSVSTFKGYFYFGSDESFHYFTAKWDFKKNRYFKISKSDLILIEPLGFGTKEIKVSLIQSDTVFGYNDSNKLYIEN